MKKLLKDSSGEPVSISILHSTRHPRLVLRPNLFVCCSFFLLLLAHIPVHASSYIYVSSSNGHVSVIGSTSKTVVATLTGGGVSITPDGAFAYISNAGPNGDATSIVDTRTNAVVQTLPLNFSPIFSPDGTRAYFKTFINNASHVIVMDTATKSFVSTIEVPNFVLSPTKVTADGQFLYAFGEDAGASTFSKIFVFATATNSLVNTISLGPEAIDFSQDGTLAYLAEVTGTDEQLVRVIDVVTGAEVKTITFTIPNPQHLGIGLRVSPDNSFLCALVQDNLLRSTLWFVDASSGAALGSIAVQPWPGSGSGPGPHDLGIGPLAFTQDGSKIYLPATEFPQLGISPLSSKIFIVDTMSRTLVGTFLSPQSPVGGIAIGPDRACGEDFTTQTVVSKSGFSPFIFPQLQVQTVTVINGRNEPIHGPITLFLNNISNGVFVGNSATSTCYGPGGAFTVVNPGADNIFSPGEILVVPLLFFKTGAGPITYNHRVVSGAPGQ